MLEADSKQRQRKRLSPNRRTTGLLSLRMFTNLLRPVNRAYPSRKPNAA